MTAELTLGGVGDEAGRGLDQQISVHRGLGWRSMEIRTIDRRPATALGEGELARTASRLAEAGIAVPVVASPIGNWAHPVTCPFEAELAELDASLRVATALGAPWIRVMSYPNDGLPEVAWRREAIRRMRELAARAEDAGAVLLVENCAGWAAADAGRALDLLTAVDTPALRLLFDVGNPVAYGYDGFAYLREVLPHVAHIHVKDAVPARPEARFCMPGEGQAQVASCIELAVDGGYEGGLSIEPELAHVIHRGDDAPDDELRRTYHDYAVRFERLLTDTFSGSYVEDGRLRMPVAVS